MTGAPKLKKVFEDFENDVKDAEFTGLPGIFLNPLAEKVAEPVVSVAADVIPAVAGAVPLPFVDDVSSAVVGVSVGAAKIGYNILPFTADADVENESDTLGSSEMMENFKNAPRTPKPLLSDLMGVVGFGANTMLDLVRLPFSGDLGKWINLTKKFVGYMATSGVGAEALAGFMSVGAPSAMMIINKVQTEKNEGSNTRRKRCAMSELPEGIADKDDFKTIVFDAIQYGRYSSAAYGSTMIASSQLLKVGGHDLSNTPIGSNLSEAKRKKRMAKYLGLEPEDIFDPTTPGGDIDIIGHFMAVDKNKKAVVLALRGTYTISGIKTDAAAYTRPFCNGLAHAGIADRTDNIWPIVKDKIGELLKANPGFDFVITGHSLGAGTAALLTLKIKHEKLLEELDASFSSVNVKCFAFASPPVYLANPEQETIMAEAMKSTYAFIHEKDCVPFMSFDALRRISAIIDEVDRQTNVIEGPLMALGAKCIPIGIKKVVMADLDLHEIDKAEKLAIPAPHVMWMRKIDEDKEGNPVYNAMFCRPAEVEGEKGTNDLQIFLDERMIADHMNPMYLRALNSIATTMKGINGADGYELKSVC